MILTFGEIMLRLSTPGHLRIRQAVPGRLEATFGGGEANVAASLAQFGDPVRFVTALPDHALTDALIANLDSYRIDTSCILRTGQGRLGIYLLETGAQQRSSTVLYDREHSAISVTPPEAYDLPRILDGITWLHITGITPALSDTAYRAVLALASEARRRAITVSCDINFRKKLWRWRPGTAPAALARTCMTAILAQVDLLIGNEEDAHDVFGIGPDQGAVETGHISPQAFVSVARQFAALFPALRRAAFTLRRSLSADHNDWGGVLIDLPSGAMHAAPLSPTQAYAPYEMRDIVDRVGGGDSFAAGLIHALRSPQLADPALAIRFAVAASCLKHSIPGDVNLVNEAEVLALMHGSGSGRIRR